MTDINLVDTHAHMGDPVFDPDRSEVLNRAKAAGVTAILTVSEDTSDAMRNMRLAKMYPMLLPTAGLSPSHLDINQAESALSIIRRESSKLWGIGEVGLDYWIAKEEAERGMQREIFQIFIDLSIELGLPLNVHSRSAGRQVRCRCRGAGAPVP